MGLASIAHYHEVFGRGEEWRRCRSTDCDGQRWDKWVCTKRVKVRNEPRYESCGAAYYFRRTKPNVVGGPRTRSLDRRYAFGYSWRCKHPGDGVLRHETAPDPEQPTQDELLFDQIEKLKIVAKEARKKRGRKKASSA